MYMAASTKDDTFDFYCAAMAVAVDGILPRGGLGNDLSHSYSSALATVEIVHGWSFTQNQGRVEDWRYISVCHIFNEMLESIFLYRI